ncbi:helix-turn-helix domain-containing protein [Vallitalea sediminicola]
MSRQRSMEKILSSEYVTIGELVRLTEFRYSTLKFYTEEGMLPFVQKDKKLTRRYDREIAVRILSKIKQLKEQGLTVAEIKNNLLK